MNMRSTRQGGIARAGAVAVGAGILACTVACSIPILAATLGGALVVSGVATAFLGQMEAVGLAVAVVGFLALGFGFVRSRVKRATASTAAGECGCAESCGPESGVDEKRVACSLDNLGGIGRATAFKAAFADGYQSRERLDDGVRWRFSDAPGRLEQLRALAAEEHACCPFFEFKIDVHDDEIWWETRTTTGAQAVLDEFFALPETLQTTNTQVRIAAMTKAFAAAGGVFGPGTSTR